MVGKKEYIDEQGRVHGIVIAKSYEAKAFGIKTGTPLWIAKLATDFNKPYGITIVPKHTIKTFVAPLSINDFPGIGKVLSSRLQSYGIKTLGEVLEAKNLLTSWGRVGKDLYARLSGNDGEAVIAHHDRRSIGIGRNFAKIHSRDELLRRVIILSRYLSHTIMTLGVSPTTYHFSLKYDGGVKSAHSITIDRPFSEALFRSLCIDTLKKIDTLPKYGVHYLSLSAGNFITKARLKTFSLLDEEEDKKACALGESITALRHKYGMDIIRSGAEKEKCIDAKGKQ